MNNWTLETARNEAIKLLVDWKTDTLHQRWELVETAEEIEASLYSSGLVTPEGNDTGLAAIVRAAYELFALAHWQRFLPEDKQVVLDLLNTPAEDAETALSEYNLYWNKVDFSEREDRALKFWFDDTTQ